MILKMFKGIKWKELKWWRVIYPEIGCKKILENWGELNSCSHIGCVTNLWVALSTHPTFPKIFPAVTQDTTA